MTTGRTSTLIVAAGAGTRAGGHLPKQYADLGGRTVLGRTLEAFLSCEAVADVTVVVASGDGDLYAGAAGEADASHRSRLREPVVGGASRQESVLKGLLSLEADEPDIVLVHDAARPFASRALIARVAAAVSATSGAVPALPVTDTLRRGAGPALGDTVDRTGLWRVQTPQGFPFAPLLSAYRSLGPDRAAEFTDDAGIAAACGMAVVRVDGDEDNMKITHPGDVDRAAAHLSGRLLPHVGLGFDVHAFGPGDHVSLCGVRIDFGRALKGHSDADVGLHALADAIYGALAEGDIGTHFPPSEETWSGADSALFVAHARDRVRARGGRIGNVDVTIVCEAPKIGPHRESIRSRLAGLLEIPQQAVSIKATTTERLGFAGRGEGIAAQAVATVLLPPCGANEETRHG